MDYKEKWKPFTSVEVKCNFLRWLIKGSSMQKLSLATVEELHNCDVTVSIEKNEDVTALFRYNSSSFVKAIPYGQAGVSSPYRRGYP
jgi:hypothetical protein